MDDYQLAPGEWRCAEIDRVAAVELIEQAMIDGRLTANEHTERVASVRQAKTYDDLNAQTADLGSVFAPHQTSSKVQWQSSSAAEDEDFDESLEPVWTPYLDPAQVDFPQLDLAPSLIQDEVSRSNRSPEKRAGIAVMGTHKRTGDWTVPESLSTFVLMGETIYDLRNAIFTSPQVTLSVAVTMGSVTLYLPDGVHVIDNTTKIMGDASFKGIQPTNPAAPQITVDGFLCMGELSVYGRGDKAWTKYKSGLNRATDD